MLTFVPPFSRTILEEECWCVPEDHPSRYRPPLTGWVYTSFPSFTTIFVLNEKNRERRKSRVACSNSFFSGGYRADVTWGTRESSPERTPFRTIGDRGRTLIRKRGRLITKFIPFTGAKVKPNYLLRIPSAIVSPCTFLHVLSNVQFRRRIPRASVKISNIQETSVSQIFN